MYKSNIIYLIEQLTSGRLKIEMALYEYKSYIDGKLLNLQLLISFDMFARVYHDGWDPNGSCYFLDVVSYIVMENLI